MPNKDHNLLLEAYNLCTFKQAEKQRLSKINEETHDFPSLKTTGKEWHKEGQTLPPNPKPEIGKMKMDSMEESPEPSLANRIDEVLEEWDPNLNYQELAMAIGEIFKKHYISQQLPVIKFLSAIERSIKS